MELAVKKQSLDKWAAEAIREQILSGAFHPGFRLVETWLSEKAGLSRGTIRAALSELAHEGLVTQIAYKKWTVTELTEEGADELFTLRAALEGLGARLSAERIDAEGRERLSAAYEKLVAASRLDDRAAVTEADFGLHKLIIEISRHSRLAAQYKLIEQQVRLIIASSNALLPTTEEVVQQHRPIVEAILGGKAGNAERLIRHHNLSEGKILSTHVGRKLAEQPAKPTLAIAAAPEEFAPPAAGVARASPRRGGKSTTSP